MILDVRTLYFAMAVTALAMGLVQLLVYLTLRSERWVAWWGVGNVASGLGLWVVVNRDPVPPIWSLVTSNGLTLVGGFMMLAGLRAFEGRDNAWTAYALVTGLSMVMLGLMWPEPAHLLSRIMWMCMVGTVLAGLCVGEGIRIFRREGLVSALLIALSFGLIALSLSARGVAALMGKLTPDTLFSPAPLSLGVMIGSVMVMPLVNMTLMLMATERYRNVWRLRAQRDPLTGLLNRAGLQSAFAQRLAEQRGGAAPMSLLLVDIDYFKTINDGCGHAKGDELLRLYARSSRQWLRASDVLARYGGDEFVVLLPGATLAEGLAVAERMRQSFSRETAGLTGLPLPPTLSVGVARADMAGQPLESLLSLADSALYLAKREGRDRVRQMAA